MIPSRLSTCARAGAWLVLDLAYAPFVDVPVLRHPAVIALHSPGKAHGLVGARPAYAVASAEVAARLDNLAPAWHLPAGTAALLAHLPEAQPFLNGTLEQVRRGALALADALRALGQVEHHGTPYLTLEVGDGARVAGALLAVPLTAVVWASVRVFRDMRGRVAHRLPALDLQEQAATAR